ncbi:TPA: histidinol phosphate phosphatase domain-containing protein [Methanosarcina acetivorans]|uniref:Histidinol phosphate phosphatase domain-containing protein n=1 Tax=Methanosarcina acetivorans TaxID=2214 RepID=A0A832SGQ7_9EURY|nr:histidinol phosphate phosphatase domain-containing protein [Methanosarcina acetivorans]HIH92662.1 histidinol phosphate phosphatase domain-containing protein [Methanosarcina acetivorans]
MIDLHTHTIFSDGEFLPSELVRHAVLHGYEAVAITDHADHTNLEWLLEAAKKAKYLEEEWDIRVLSGVELTHVPPRKIAPLSKKAKELGAEIVVVHGETISEPVAPGTNSASVACEYVDILAHPGLISEEDVQTAVDNNVLLEITTRNGHNRTNGHVARLALEIGATLVVNTDTHGPGNLITDETALKIAMGAGLTESRVKEAFEASKKKVAEIV